MPPHTMASNPQHGWGWGGDDAVTTPCARLGLYQVEPDGTAWMCSILPAVPGGFYCSWSPHDTWVG